MIDTKDEAFLKEFDFSKKLGQNFLIDSNAKNKILTFINDASKNTSNIIEIGPGMGAVTKLLLDENKNIIAIELDKNLNDFLLEKFGKYTNFNIYNKDCLTFDFSKITNSNDLIFSNTPYSITTAMITKFITSWKQFQAVFLMQKEVAEKITCLKGTKKYSAFTVFCQSFLVVKKLYNIKPSAFLPPPKVDSTLVFLKKKNILKYFNYEEYIHFLFLCFGMRRKTLFNNLKSKYSIDRLTELFNNNGLSLNIRAQELSFEIFFTLYKQLYEKNI